MLKKTMYDDAKKLINAYENIIYMQIFIIRSKKNMIKYLPEIIFINQKSILLCHKS